MSHCKSSLCLAVFTFTLAWSTSATAQITQGVTETTFSFDDSADAGNIYINDSGTIAGYYIITDDLTNGFIQRPDGVVTLIDVPLANPIVTGINTAGTIIGWGYADSDYGSSSAFLLDSSGQYTAIEIPGTYYIIPLAISSSGAITGICGFGCDNCYNDYQRTFVRSASGVIKTFKTPGDLAGSYDAGPSAINDNGTIVGSFSDHKRVAHGYIRDVDGEIATLDVPGSTGTYLSDINNKGEITGEITGYGYRSGFIRKSNGQLTIFPTIYPGHINQAGDICGVDADYNTVIRYSDGKVATLTALGDSDYRCTGINSSRTVVGSLDGTVSYFISEPLSTIDFSSGFSATSDSLNLTGSAALNGSHLMLTNGKDSEASSAYYVYPVDVRSFSTDFTFQPSDAVADGLTFTIQNDDPSAVGFPGAGLGYQRIDKSVAIKFDFHNNFGEGSDSTGLYLNGVSPTIPAIDLSHTGINLASGDPIKVHVTYDSASTSENLTLTITDDFTMDTWSKSFTVDIPGTVGATTAYVGFTASTGEKTSTLALSSWTYQAGSTTP